MGDAGLNRLFSSLEASFEAAIAAEDDLVAGDLAMSLRQGRTLVDVATRSGPLDVVRSSGARVPVEFVGADFVIGFGAHRILFPIDRLILASGTATAPKQLPASMVEVLRAAAREGRRVTLELLEGEKRQGRLLAVGPDHVSIDTPVGELLVGLEAVASVSFEGGVDLA